MRDPTTSAWKDSTLGVQCTPECPSDLALDAMHLNEAKDSEAAAWMKHIQACQSCEARWALRQDGLAAFPALDRDAMVARLHQLTAQIKAPAAPSFWQQVRSVFAQPAVFGTSMAMFAIVMMLVVTPEPGPLTDTDTTSVRPKGPGFTVFRNANDAIEILADGGSVQVGDKLRFKVNPQDGTEVMVVGQEATGKLYLAYPLDGTEASKPSTASQEGILPGTIALDQSLGREKLYLIACEQPFGLSNIQAVDDKLNVPQGCRTTAFEINKVSP